MIATIVNNKDIILSHITVWEEEVVDSHFSVKQPDAYFAPNFNRSHVWDGYYRKYNRNKKRLARPLLGELIGMCYAKDIPISVEDVRSACIVPKVASEAITPNFLPGITLRDFQVDAIRAALTAEVGIYDISTGGGKTEIIAGICKAIHCSTIILTESKIVVDQIKSRLQVRQICDEPGMFYAGKMPDGQVIVIGTIQSLIIPKVSPKAPEPNGYKTAESYERARERYDLKMKAFKKRINNAKILHGVVAKADMLIIDEADVCVSNNWNKLFKHWYKGRRRYGFTGTPYNVDKPVEWMVLRENVGSIIYRQHRDEVLNEGLTVPLEYFMIPFGMDGRRTESSAYDIATDEYMVRSETFHTLIADLVNSFPEDENVLILIDRDELGRNLEEAIPNSKLCNGKTPKKMRDEIISKFEQKKLRCMIGGKNVRRGMDLKGGCNHLILANGGKNTSELDQRLGRARRLNDKGVAKVWDFFFCCNKYLCAHSRKRLLFVNNMSYNSYFLNAKGGITLDAFINRGYKIPVNVDMSLDELCIPYVKNVVESQFICCSK